MLKYNIKNLKNQIKIHEKHGKGTIVMEQKALLKKAERKWELRNG